MQIRWRLLRMVASGLVLLAAAIAVAPLAGPAGATSAASLASAPAAERPAWHHLPLTDARTGQTFTLADFEGKTVFVEPMATWCTNCRQQMGVIRDELRPQLDPAQYVVVALSVETNLTGDTLAGYADTHGFDWTFAVMTPELLQELAATFGRTVANPPATPHFVIGPTGVTSDLSTGFHSADSLLARLTAAAGS